MRPGSAHRILHAKLVFNRRKRVLAARIAGLLPDRGDILDVGCGSGEIAARIMRDHPRLRVSGVDVLIRPDTAIPARPFDGKTLPFGNEAFDYALLVDVLHHAEEPLRLLAECSRVSRLGVIVKDHVAGGWLDFSTLSLMDWVGNRPYHVRLPRNYLSRSQWTEAWSQCGLAIDTESSSLGLYPAPFSLIFERRLHFLGRYTKGFAAHLAASND